PGSPTTASAGAGAESREGPCPCPRFARSLRLSPDGSAADRHEGGSHASVPVCPRPVFPCDCAVHCPRAAPAAAAAGTARRPAGREPEAAHGGGGSTAPDASPCCSSDGPEREPHGALHADIQGGEGRQRGAEGPVVRPRAG